MKKKNLNKSTLFAGAGLLNYITFLFLSLFYAVKSFTVIPVHCWVATSMWWLVCQVEVLWRWMSQTLEDGFFFTFFFNLGVRGDSKEKKKGKQEVEDKEEREWMSCSRGEQHWDPVHYGRQQLVEKEKGEEKRGRISHGGFECKQFLHSILFRETILQSSSSLVEHWTHLLSKTECRNQRPRGAALQGENMDRVAMMC